MSFETATAYESAKKILLRAADNFRRRDPAKVAIPDIKKPMVAGFSVEAIKYMLGGSFRASFRPLNDAIIQGRIRGVAGIVGCNNPKQKLDEYINTLTAELLKRNVLVLKTGCAAIASAKAGFLTPETALEYAGDGLREVCEAVGMPPVLHMGSCVDNSRLLEAASEIVFEGGLGDDLSDLPVVGVAPEWMSEKAVAIGTYFRGLRGGRGPGSSLLYLGIGERDELPEPGSAGPLRSVLPCSRGPAGSGRCHHGHHRAKAR